MKKKTLLLLFISFTFFSCSKDPSLTSIQYLKNILVGNGYVASSWHLTEYSINQISQPLTYAQRNFSKEYKINGSFKSNDGFEGTWELPSTDSLVEVYQNLPSGVNSTQSYKVLSVSSNLLILQYNYNGNKIVTTYSSVY